jgi:glycosyltransferase involved in cell wall biosynthesis
LVNALAGLAGAREFLIWVPHEWKLEPGAFELRRTHPGLRAKATTEWLEIPRAIREGRVDHLLSLGDTSCPRPGVPHVLFVQQAFLAYSPAEWGFAPPLRMRAKAELMSQYFRAGRAGVTSFVVQTEDMRRHLAARWSIPLANIHVVPSAVSESVRAVAREHHRPADPHYLCYVANAGPHKNHEVLVEMMESLADHPALRCRLTLQRGELPQFEERARARGVLDRLDFVGRLPPRETLELHARARVAVIPAVLESFGLGYYEALALGKPVVAADRGFAREACGDAASYAPASNGAAFAERVREQLAGDAAEQDTRSRARFAAVDFPPASAARRFLEILEA